MQLITNIPSKLTSVHLVSATRTSEQVLWVLACRMLWLLLENHLVCHLQSNRLAIAGINLLLPLVWRRVMDLEPPSRRWNHWGSVLRELELWRKFHWGSGWGWRGRIPWLLPSACLPVSHHSPILAKSSRKLDAMGAWKKYSMPECPLLSTSPPDRAGKGQARDQHNGQLTLRNGGLNE